MSCMLVCNDLWFNMLPFNSIEEAIEYKYYKLFYNNKKSNFIHNKNYFGIETKLHVFIVA